MHMALATRPDIIYAISYLSQYNNCYNEVHFNAEKRFLKYLKETEERNNLIYKKIIKN